MRLVVSNTYRAGHDFLQPGASKATPARVGEATRVASFRLYYQCLAFVQKSFFRGL